MPISLDGTLGINSSGNVTAPYYYGNGFYLTGISGGGSSNATALVSGNSSITFDGAGNAVINIGGTNVGTFTPQGLTVTGNINPGANVTYTLGNATNQWKDLWVSNNTIYINSIPLTVNGAGNTLYVANVPVVTANTVNTGNVATTGNLTAGTGAGNITTVANVGIVFPDGTVQTTAGGAGGSYGNANVSLYLASGTANANIITTANIAGAYYTGNVNSNLISSTSALMIVDPGADGSPLTGNVSVLGNLNVTGTLTYVDISLATTSNLVWEAANSASTAVAASGGGLGVGPSTAPYATLKYNAGANAWLTNIPLTVSGNTTANYFIGNGSQLTGIVSSYGDANVGALLASGTLATNIITTANVSGGNLIATTNVSGVNLTATSNVNGVNVNATGNVAAVNVAATANVTAGNVVATNVLTDNYKYANGVAVSFGQPIFVTSNISIVNAGAPILVASSYGNATYPGGVFTLYQPTGAVLSASALWASGGASKNQYANYAGNAVNTQNISMTLGVANGTFNIQSSDSINIGGSIVTGANITGLGISGAGGTYTIPSSMFAANVQTNLSTAVSVSLTTSTGVQTVAAGTLTTVAPTPFDITTLTAAWANANVILGSSVQSFTWTAGGLVGSVNSSNVALTGTYSASLGTGTATSGTSSTYPSDSGTYTVNATFTGTGLNGAGTRTVTLTPYSLAAANSIAPLFYKITGNSSNPGFTTADSHYNIALTIPTASIGQAMPSNAQGMLSSGNVNDYNWLALPGGSGTWTFGNITPTNNSENAAGTNVLAMIDQNPFNQIVLGTPSAGNFGAQYFTTIGGQPYTVAGWSQASQPVFIYLANVV